MAEVIINYDSAIKEIEKYQKKITELGKKEEELRGKLKDGTITRKDYTKEIGNTRSELGKYEKSLKTISGEIGETLKKQKKLAEESEELKRKIKLLEDAYDKLGETEKRGAQGEVLLKNIMQLEGELRSTERTLNDFTNVTGDFENSLLGLTGELAKVSQYLETAAANGEENSEAYQLMAEKAAELQEAIRTVNGEIEETGYARIELDALNESVKVVTDAYDLFKSVTSGLGIEHEDLDEAMGIVSSTMGALNKAVGIYNAFAKNSIILKGMETVKTYLQAGAITAETAAKTKSGVASKLAAAAQWLFNVAMTANPIGLFVALVVGAVAAVYGLVKAFNIFSSSGRENKKALQEQGEQLEKNMKNDERHLALMKVKGETEQAVTNKSIELYKDQFAKVTDYVEKVGKAYKKDSDEYKKAVEMKEEAQERFEQALESGYDSLLKIQAQAEEDNLKESMGDLKYATHQANKAFEEQIETLRLLQKEGKITAEEAEELEATLRGVRDKTINEATQKEEDKQNAEAAKKAKAARDAELKAVKEAEDAMLSLIKDGVEKQRLQTNLSYDRELGDLQKRLDTEKNLTTKAKEEIQKKMQVLEMQRAEELKKLSDEEIARQIEKEQERLTAMLAEIEAGSKEELKLRLELMEKQKEAELNVIGDAEEKKQEIRDRFAFLMDGTEEADKLATLQQAMDAELEMIEEGEKEKLKIQERYLQEEEAIREENRQKRIEKEKEELLEDFERRIEEATAISDEELLLELERLEERLNTLHKLDEELEEEFLARKTAAQERYYQAKKKFTDEEMAMEQKKKEVMTQLEEGITDLLASSAENSKAMAIASKMIALGEIAVNTGKAISAGVAQAQKVPFPFNIAAIATTVAAVMSNINTAISTVKSAKFAKGGLVTGPGNESSDSIPAMLSNGESVMTARATQMFAPVLSAFNTMGGGVPISTIGSSNTVMGEDMLAQAVAKGVMSMPAPVVAVEEINSVNRGIKVIQDLRSISL